MITIQNYLQKVIPKNSKKLKTQNPTPYPRYTYCLNPLPTTSRCHRRYSTRTR
jgi:hypothetical protein